MDNIRKARALKLYKLSKIIDDDDEDELHFALLVSGQKQRRVKWKHQRIDWDIHLKMLRHTGGFQSRYHMTESTFNKLVDILREALEKNERQSIRSTGGNDPITSEMTVAAGLRFLGGSLVKDIADLFGMSYSSVHRIVNLFLLAVNTHEHFKIEVTQTPDQLKACADGFQSISSSFGIYYGCIGAIDGWLCCVNSPRVTNPVDYHSGHYHRHGVNVQAVCDDRLRFLYFAVAAPGRTNDVRAFNRCLSLRVWLQSLPAGYFVVGDNAYTLSNRMLVPFRGNQKKDPHKRSYNYYLSQMRIRIEMAFGRLSTKWRIFRRNLDVSLEKTSLICIVAAKLHNFVIDNDNLCFNPSTNISDFGIDRFPGTGEYNRGYLPTLMTTAESEELTRGEVGDVVHRREQILVEIEEKMLCRPQHNLERNKELDANSVFESERTGEQQEKAYFPQEIMMSSEYVLT